MRGHNSSSINVPLDSINILSAFDEIERLFRILDEKLNLWLKIVSSTVSLRNLDLTDNRLKRQSVVVMGPGQKFLTQVKFLWLGSVGSANYGLGSNLEILP